MDGLFVESIIIIIYSYHVYFPRYLLSIYKERCDKQ